jgi:hypothetical protein
MHSQCQFQTTVASIGAKMNKAKQFSMIANNDVTSTRDAIDIAFTVSIFTRWVRVREYIFI